MTDQDQDALVRNAANPKQVKKAGYQESREQRQEMEDLRFILSLPQGRRFVRRLFLACRIHQPSADNSGSWTYFNEGIRHVGLELLQQVMEADLGAYCQMLQDEQKEKLNGN